jgi:hypothetical protein
MSKAQWLFNQFSILHFLAQFEDERVLPELEGVLFLYGPLYIPWAEYHLEPGEKDPEWLYWHMRTKGMDTTETIKTILQSIGNGGPGRFKYKILPLFGEQAVPLLLRAVVEPPPRQNPENVQGMAIWVLGEMRSQQAVELLRSVLRTGTRRLRRNAATALGQIGDPSALPDLLEVAQSDADASPQMIAFDALGELGDSRAAFRMVRGKHLPPVPYSHAVRTIQWRGQVWRIHSSPASLLAPYTFSGRGVSHSV